MKHCEPQTPLSQMRPVPQLVPAVTFDQPTVLLEGSHFWHWDVGLEAIG
jgi:hypothetical protein